MGRIIDSMDVIMKRVVKWPAVPASHMIALGQALGSFKDKSIKLYTRAGVLYSF